MPVGAHEFWRAVESFQVDDLPLVIEAAAERRLRSCVTGGGPILLGETHGAAENPLAILTLMHRLDVQVLALEWPPDLGAAVFRYQNGDGLDFSGVAWSSDGRITAGHWAVLRELHRHGDLHRLVLFDAPLVDGWSSRDRLMAERLLAGLDKTPPALVVAGNLHTSLRPHQHGVPMGYHVAQARPATLEVKIEYLNGEIFNLGRRRIGGGIGIVRRASKPTLRVASDRLVMTLPTVHAAVVPNPEGRPPSC